MAKRSCKYLERFSIKYSFITKGRTDYEAFCKHCKTYISISHGGVSDIKCHIMKTKHQQKVNASASSKKVSSFFVKESSSKLIATEICLAYHVVKHHQSFNSSNCNNTLFPKLFADSDVALKLSSEKTKSIVLYYILITHVLSLFDMMLNFVENLLENERGPRSDQ
jgi:hypothetical protein